MYHPPIDSTNYLLPVDLLDKLDLERPEASLI